MTERVKRSRPKKSGHLRDLQVTRTAILAAATSVFTKQGIDRARVEDILIAAKVARRTFYKYFSSKEEVLAALFEVFTAELVRAVEAARDAEPSKPLAGIRAGIDVFLGFTRSGPRVVRELIEIAIRSDSLLAPRRRWFRTRIVELLDDSVHALDGRRLDPFVYYGLLSALEGLSLELGAPDTTEADVERARKVTHALVDQALGLPEATPLPRARRSSRGAC